MGRSQRWLMVAMWCAVLPAMAADPAPAVLVELFTSEGCSSCPPADALLARLDAEQPVAGATVVLLAHHVDYWDRLGWRDRFSSPEAGRRQREYTRAFGRDPYTPQVVVDGRVELVGSREVALVHAIRDAARRSRAGLVIEAAPGEEPRLWRVEARVERLPDGVDEPVELFLAVTEEGLASRVTGGENRGRRLRHAGVVRALRRLGRVDAGELPSRRRTGIRMEEGWRVDRSRLVAFVQGRRSRRVYGSIALPLSTGRD